MSHADDGTLHAYLDGELSAVERAQLETHLAECATCRARVEEERALIERAQGLLARVAPPSSAPPPFRQVTRRVGSPLPRWVPLAWAASVLLALGGGWLAGGVGSRSVALGEPEAPASLAVGEADQADRPTDLYDSAARSAAPSTSVPATQSPTADAGGTRAPADPSRRTAEAKVAGGEREQGQVAAVPRAEAAADFAGPERAAPPSPAPQAAIGVTPGAANVYVDGASVRSLVSLDSARAILRAEPVAIPGLPVARVSVEGGRVVVEQRLDSSVVVRLIERPAANVDELQFRTRDRENARVVGRQGFATELLARYVGSLRVEIAGPLTADSLSRLLELVRPIR